MPECAAARQRPVGRHRVSRDRHSRPL